MKGKPAMAAYLKIFLPDDECTDRKIANLINYVNTHFEDAEHSLTEGSHETLKRWFELAHGYPEKQKEKEKSQ